MMRRMRMRKRIRKRMRKRKEMMMMKRRRKRRRKKRRTMKDKEETNDDDDDEVYGIEVQQRRKRGRIVRRQGMNEDTPDTTADAGDVEENGIEQHEGHETHTQYADERCT